MTRVPAAPATALQATVVTDAAALAPHAAAWDALADACSRPFCVSGWLLGWWAHARPARARLAVVLVHDGDELVGVAPGFCDRGPAGIVRWRPLAAHTCQRVEPFAAAGHEQEVAREVARALHALRPQPQVLSFEGVDARSPWPGLLATAWPGPRPARRFRTGTTTAMVLRSAGTDADAWMAGRGPHFRKRLRRLERLAAAAGATVRLADAGSAAADLEAFVRLHVGRWEGRGGSGVLSPEVTAFVRAVGPELVSAGRLRIWSFDLDGEVVATGLLLHAGEEVGYWLGGFDTEHGKLELSKLVMLEVIRDGHRLGTRKVDLGEGDFAYKRRFTEDEEELVRVLVVLPSRRGVQAAAGVAPALARTWVATHLSPEHKGRARDLLARAKAVRP